MPWPSKVISTSIVASGGEPRVDASEAEAEEAAFRREDELVVVVEEDEGDGGFLVKREERTAAILAWSQCSSMLSGKSGES